VRTRLGMRAAVTCAVAVTLLAGCQRGAAQEPEAVGPTDNGVSALPANDILNRAKSALRQAKSYRVKGNGKADGQKIGIDFRISGNDLGGKLTMGNANVELLSVAGKHYMRPDEKFWVSAVGVDKAPTVAKLIGDRWVVVPEDDNDFAELFGIANVDEMLKPDGSLSKGETTDINGVKAIGLVDNDSEKGTLYVATTGEPYPLRLLSTSTVEGGQIDFTDFGATFADLKAPPESEVIDLKELSRN
jgi:hypothetical protein